MDTQWLDMENEHFIVWMRLSGLPNFRKLWGKIEGGLDVGMYQIEVANNYSVIRNQGQKKFVLSTANSFGGNNKFLSGMFVLLGSINFVFAILFFCVWCKNKK